MRKYILFLLVCIKSISQTNQYLPTKTTVQSPEISSFSKYIDMPIGTSTGIPDINIPLFNIKNGNTEVNVNLSYHAGGFKVDETASSVGLGWSLNAGGMIGRVVKSYPDDLGGIITNSFNPNNVGLPISPLNECSINAFIDYLDTEADLFYYNFLNYSGKFQYNKMTNSFIKLNENNLKITPYYDNFGKLVKFKIITPEGISCFFGKNEDETRSAVDKNSSNISFATGSAGHSAIPNSNYGAITSWYLMEIVDESQNKINFFYDSVLNATELKKINQDILYSTLGACLGNPINDLLNYRLVNRYSLSTSENYYLKKIETLDKRIEFEMDNDRIDYIGAKKINKLKLIRSLDNALIKQYQFQYSYFVTAQTANDIDLNIPYSSTQEITTRYNRLKLISLTEQTITNNQIISLPSYLFEYNNQSLPYKFTNGRDYWGFYNGKDNNLNMIPRLMKDGKELYPTAGFGDRSVDVEKCKAGIISKITYPTGGTIEYEFESNMVNRVSNNYNKEQRFNLRNRLTDYQLLFSKDSNTNYISSTDKYISNTFQISANTIGNINFNITMSGCSQENLGNFQCDFLIKLFKIQNNSNVFVRDLTSSNLDLDLLSGNYFLEINKMGSSISNSTETGFNIQINWSVDPNPDVLYVGGLRIKNIFIKEKGVLVLQKHYNYERVVTPEESVLTNKNYVSSGVLVSKPSNIKNFKRSTLWFLGDSYDYDYRNELKINSSSNIEMITNNGAFIIYGKVSEIVSDKAKVESYFDTTNNAFADNNYDNYTDEPYNEGARGYLLQKKYFRFDDNTNTFLIIKQEDFETDIINTNIANFGILRAPNDFYVLCCGNPYLCYTKSEVLQPYGQTSIINRTRKTTETNYYNTDNIIVTSIEHLYENNFLLPSTTKTTNSKGETLETKYYYAPDPELTNEPYRTDLIAKNMIGIPLLTQTFKNGIKLSEQKTQYSKDASTNNLLLPKYIKAKKGTDADQPNLETKITYNSYDNKGNLTQYTLESGIPVSYIWGYNQTQPIAKIENASYSQVSSYVNNLQTLSNGTNEALLLTALDALRSNLPNAMVTTYTYIPLVGVSTITDPKADRQTFTYDTFGRLQYVKDKNGNILSENQYHYRP